MRTAMPSSEPRLPDSLPVATRACFALSLAAGLVAATYAIRLRFDIAVFERWAASSDLDAAMQAFDARLQRFMPWRRVAPRSMSERIAGAERLRRRRNGWFGLQLLAWLLSMLPIALR
jgi:hypothetical protein